MKKGKSHIIPRCKSFDDLHKQMKGKPAILKGMNPAAMEPMAITMQKEFQNNDPDAAKLFFAPPSGWVEE